MTLRIIIALLCVAGSCVATLMFVKQLRIERGDLHEDSVVSTPRAKVAGVSNGLIGYFYYVALLVALPFLHHPLVYDAALAATVLAALFSAYLAYSLLFITRRECAYCWTGHTINWLILLALTLGKPWLTAG
jgi:uncharacterized membrane protein